MHGCSYGGPWAFPLYRSGRHPAAAGGKSAAWRSRDVEQQYDKAGAFEHSAANIFGFLFTIKILIAFSYTHIVKLNICSLIIVLLSYRPLHACGLLSACIINIVTVAVIFRGCSHCAKTDGFIIRPGIVAYQFNYKRGTREYCYPAVLSIFMNPY